MMYLHATSRDRLSSIREAGLSIRYHRLRRPAIWLARPSAGSWAAIHAMRRHGVRPEDVVLVYVDVPEPWVRRFRHPGLYWCVRDIPAERIRRVEGFQLVREEIA
jgi:hypothetical protein